MSGRCVISALEKKDDIKTMVDTCTIDRDCKKIKIQKDMPYDKNFLDRSPKLCLGNNSYIDVGGKYKKSRKSIKKSRRKKRKKRKSRRHR